MLLNRDANSSRFASRFRVAVAILCVMLILLVGAAGLLHRHAAGQPEDAGCSLCAVAHLVAAPAAEAASLVQVEMLRTVPEEVPRAAVVQALPFVLYVRPPPVV